MASGTKRKANSSGNQQLVTSKRIATFNEDYRTLVCAVRGLYGRVVAIPIRADASIHHLKELIHWQNASQLTGVIPAMLDAYSTYDRRLGWARLSANGGMIGRGDPRPKSFLIPTKRVQDYFPVNIPPHISGVVHVVVDFVVHNSAVSALTVQSPRVLFQVNEVGTMPLADDKPLPGEGEGNEIECERYSRVAQALGLFVCWSISGTDFSQPHDYQGAKWLQYDAYGRGPPSRVFIGDKTTWRELYVACNEVVQKQEGREGFRFVEGFYRVNGGPTLELGIGT